MVKRVATSTKHDIFNFLLGFLADIGFKLDLEKNKENCVNLLKKYIYNYCVKMYFGFHDKYHG